MLVFVPCVVIVLFVMVFPEAVVKRKIPLLLVLVPFVFMVLFVMALLFALVVRRIP